MAKPAGADGPAALPPQPPQSTAFAPVQDHHSGAFLRLSQLWLQRSHFSLVLAIVDNPDHRDALIGRLNALRPAQRLDLDDAAPPALWLQQAQAAAAAGLDRLHLCLPLARPRASGWWQQANLLRERLGEALPGVQLLWLSAADADAAAHQAPDLWNWRESVLSFVAPVPTLSHLPALPGHRFDGQTGQDAAVLGQRLAQIEAHLAAQDEPDSAGAHLALEAARGHQALGQWGQATAAAQRAATWFEGLGDAGHGAEATAELADLIWRMGDPSRALRLLQMDVLPVYERLGDVRSKAVTMGQVADILQARGQLDEALRIRQEEQLPVYERLGDVRAKAVTMGKVADILQARGQLDEALRIRQEEELPVYERLGDVRAKAVTQYKVADALALQGHQARALAMLAEQVLPVFERLGLGRELAITQSRVAELQANMASDRGD